MTYYFYREVFCAVLSRTEGKEPNTCFVRLTRYGVPCVWLLTQVCIIKKWKETKLWPCWTNTCGIWVTSYRKKSTVIRAFQVCKFGQFSGALSVIGSCKHYTAWFLLCLGVIYLDESDVCGVSMSSYPHRASWKICLTTVGIESTTFGMLAQCSANWATRSGRLGRRIFCNWVYVLRRQRNLKCFHDFY